MRLHIRIDLLQKTALLGNTEKKLGKLKSLSQLPRKLIASIRTKL
jgi:hypothetical protein